jgi:hypothetical protein
LFDAQSKNLVIEMKKLVRRAKDVLQGDLNTHSPSMAPGNDLCASILDARKLYRYTPQHLLEEGIRDEFRTLGSQIEDFSYRFMHRAATWKRISPNEASGDQRAEVMMTSCQQADILMDTIAAVLFHAKAILRQASNELEDQFNFHPGSAIPLALKDVDRRCSDFNSCMRLTRTPDSCSMNCSRICRQ